MVYIFWISLFLFLFVVVFSLYQRSKGASLSGTDVKHEKVIELSDESFDEEVKSGVALVDFWAPWCAPCRIQNPVISQLADEMGDHVKICKINVDEHKKAAIRMKIKNIPNVIIFKDGQPVRQLIGLKPKHTILKALRSVTEA